MSFVGQKGYNVNWWVRTGDYPDLYDLRWHYFAGPATSRFRFIFHPNNIVVDNPEDPLKFFIEQPDGNKIELDPDVIMGKIPMNWVDGNVGTFRIISSIPVSSDPVATPPYNNGGSQLANYPDGSPKPFRDGILFKGSSATVYVMENGLKRGIVSEQTFNGLGYKSRNILQVSDAEVNAVPDGNPLDLNIIHPDGTLLKGSGATVYVLEKGQKRGIISEKAFLSQYKWNEIIELEDNTLTRYSNGPVKVFRDGILIKGSSATVYVIENGQKRGIASPDVFNAYDYKWGNILSVTDTEIEAVPTGSVLKLQIPYPDGTLLKGSSDTVYVLEGGKKRGVISAKAFLTQYKWNDIIHVSNRVLQGFSDGPAKVFRDGTLIKGSSASVYVVSNGQKRGISSSSVLHGLGWDWDDVLDVTDTEINAVPNGPVLSSAQTHPDGTLLKGSSDTVYVLEGGKKRGIISEKAFLTQYKWREIVNVSNAKLAQYPNGSAKVFRDGTLIKGSSATVYVIENGQKRPISSEQTFNALGFDWGNILVVSDAEVNAVPDGNPLDLNIIHPDGTLLKGSGATVYVLEKGQKRGIISKKAFLSQYKWNEIIELEDNILTRYSNGPVKVFRDGTLIKGSSATVYIIENGQKRPISSEQTFNALGFDWGNILVVSDAEVNAVPDGNPLDLNIIHPDGTLLKGSGATVYVIENGQKRGIISEKAFLSQYKWNEIIELEDNILTRYSNGPVKVFRDGTLIKGSSATVYVIENGQKRGIVSEVSFDIYGYDWDNILNVSDVELNAVPTGPVLPEISSVHPDGSILKGRTKTVYVIESGAKRPIISENAFLTQYRWKEIIDVQDGEAALIISQIEHDYDGTVASPSTTSPPSNRAGIHIVSHNEFVHCIANFEPSVFLVPPTTDKLVNFHLYTRPYGSLGAIVLHDESSVPNANNCTFECMGYRWENVIDILDVDLNQVPTGANLDFSRIHPDGTLIQGLTDTVYVLEGGQKRGIISANAFLTQYRWQDIVHVDEEELSSYPVGPHKVFRDGSLIKGSTDAVYFIENNIRRGFISAQVFLDLGFNWNNVWDVTDSELNLLPEGPPITGTNAHPDGTLLKGSSNTVYVLEGGEKRPIISSEAFLSIYRWSEIVDVSDTTLAQYPDGPAKGFRDGVLIKGSGPTVYVIENGMKRPITSGGAAKRVYGQGGDSAYLGETGVISNTTPPTPPYIVVLPADKFSSGVAFQFDFVANVVSHYETVNVEFDSDAWDRDTRNLIRNYLAAGALELLTAFDGRYTFSKFQFHKNSTWYNGDIQITTETDGEELCDVSGCRSCSTTTIIVLLKCHWDPADPEVLVHEWGHWWYDLGDEYVEGSFVRLCPNSIMASRRVRNFNFCWKGNHIESKKSDQKNSCWEDIGGWSPRGTPQTDHFTGIQNKLMKLIKWEVID